MGFFPINLENNGIVYLFAASLPRLVEEVKDIAAINQWKYHVYESSLSFSKKSF